jgi:hypothetical protein
MRWAEEYATIRGESEFREGTKALIAERWRDA